MLELCYQNVSEEQLGDACGEHMYELEEAYVWSEFYYRTDVRYVELWYNVDHFIGFLVKDSFKRILTNLFFFLVCYQGREISQWPTSWRDAELLQGEGGQEKKVTFLKAR